MTKKIETQNVDSLNQELLKLLEARSPKALKVIAKLKSIGTKEKNNSLIGYAYYRYAYYYYFTTQDLQKFHMYLQLAIKYLLRSDNLEYLGGAYNLVAYDAQDLGCYDVAYAYITMAINASEQVEGIALPGILEANAGRLLLELGEANKGRKQLRKAIKIINKFKDMHVYHYNMIITYADESLASFVLRDAKGVEKAFQQIDRHYKKASKEEKKLCETYYQLSLVYLALLRKNEKALKKHLQIMFKDGEVDNAADLIGLIFELEELFKGMLENGYTKQAKQLLDATAILKKGDNLSVGLRYYALAIRYYQETNKKKEMNECLRAQNRLQKKEKAEASRIRKYAMEFSDMIENITKESMLVAEENILLQNQANTDALTGLPNRNAMNKKLAEMFEMAKQEKNTFSIGIIDIDGFKNFNDRYGHQVGDECLKLIGKVLKQFVDKDNMFTARYGGDEFVVAYVGYSEKEIQKISEYMSKEVTKQSGESKYKEKTYISQGIYQAIPKGKDKVWDYLSIADQRLYKIKKDKSLG